MMALLRTIATLGIHDCWIGAGVIWNAVWDYLHDNPVQLALGSDVDVVYCDHRNANSETTRAVRQMSATGISTLLQMNAFCASENREVFIALVRAASARRHNPVQ